MSREDRTDVSPDPGLAPGLEPGGGVQPGDTPPMADQLPGATEAEAATPNKGPVSGNRTPMVVTLALLGVLVVMCAALIVASFVPS